MSVPMELRVVDKSDLGHKKAKALRKRIDEASHDRTAGGFHGLIEEGLPLNGFRVPPLIVLAALGPSYTAVDYLIRRGADVNAKRSDGLTALMACARYGNADDVERLLKAGADPNAEDGKGRTALIHAIRYDESEIINLLLAYGASPWLKDHRGVNAFGFIKKLEARAVSRHRREARDDYRRMSQILRRRGKPQGYVN